jgi:predicted RNase H-like nuclease (RuvC/YqgF family)
MIMMNRDITDEEVTLVEVDADDASVLEETPDEKIQFGAASALMSLEELIKNHIKTIDTLKDELRQQKEMFEDSFNNDPVYREHVEKAKEAAKAKNAVRQQIAKQPSVAVLDQKIKDMRFDLSEQNKTLSDLLQDYKEQTGATQIEVNGKTYAIVSVSKLVTKNAKYNP